MAHTAPYPVSTTSQSGALARRAAVVPWYVWCAAIAVTSTTVGLYWDISWHTSIGRDTFWTPASLHSFWSNPRRAFERVSDSHDHVWKKSCQAGTLHSDLGVLRAAWSIRRALGRAHYAYFGSFRRLVAQRLRPGCSDPQPTPRGAHPGNFHLRFRRPVSDHRRDESRKRGDPRNPEPNFPPRRLHADDSPVDAYLGIHELYPISQRDLLSRTGIGHAAGPRRHRPGFWIQVGGDKGRGLLLCALVAGTLVGATCAGRA